MNCFDSLIPTYIESNLVPTIAHVISHFICTYVLFKLRLQAIGNTLAAISKAPKGYVKGEGIEEVLARASFCLEQGNIKQALAELDAVSGYARVLMNDWESQAKSRLLADQSSKALRASAALRHSSFA
jgi:hypothetical protein